MNATGNPLLPSCSQYRGPLMCSATSSSLHRDPFPLRGRVGVGVVSPLRWVVAVVGPPPRRVQPCPPWVSSRSDWGAKHDSVPIGGPDPKLLHAPWLIAQALDDLGMVGLDRPV